MTEPSGLTTKEAEERLNKFGENILELKKKSIWLRLFTFFWGPIPWMIEIAAILSGYLQRWPDLIMILALLFINAILGFFQEFKANNAIETLKSKLALKARVKRDGKWQNIEAKALVPGDAVFVKLGNIIPADIKLVSGEYLSVDQSSLTGESLPVDKKVGDTAYSGTTAKLGEMVGEVTETGLRTFFGKTAKLVATAKSKSHFQEAVLKIGHFLIFLTLGIAAILLVIALFRTQVSHTLHLELGNLVIFLLVLIIAGIPVALPAVLSMTMAIGANRMAKLKAIVSKLIAIEELAGMDILCSDKTGTLTKNELTVGEVTSFEKSADDVLFAAVLASDLTGEDAIDQAIVHEAKNIDAIKKYKVEKFIPFDPVRKRTEVILTTPEGKPLHVSKGAPQMVLELAKPDETFAKKVNDAVDAFAARGFRTLGVAEGDGNSWKFLGLIPLFDPPRDDTRETVDSARAMDVKIKMVTGDHTAIAREISSKLDLGPNIMPAKEITEDNIETADGFAEVFPEHKFKIVQTFQKKNHIVGMTGDGINDAPALKQADIGIAVSNATDAARAAADLILTDPGLMVIKKAIDEARCIFGRMKSYAMYRISETCRLLFFLFLAMILFKIQPLTAVMIILIALLNDIPIMMIAYDHMRIEKEPVKWNMKEIFTISIGLATVGVISTFGLFWIGQEMWDFDLAHIRTLAFLAILCGGNLTIYLTRNTGTLFERPLPEWKFFLATLFSQVIGTLVSVYGLNTSDFSGIGWKYVGWSWLYIGAWFIICMVVKIALYKLIGYETARHARFLDETSENLISHCCKK
ncbi:MAG: plasma-membrane proton-efflux P-type ATPase [Simkaniaceae bacterium]|nr:MAG: plasma-membrane proton-efflux P-type ATPase [Simkaniaceae bacterium]